MDVKTIEEMASMYGSPIDPRRGNVHVNCPWSQYHSKGIDTSQGLSVKIAPGQRSVAYCFSCHTKGTLLFVFQEAARLDPSFNAVAQFILQRDGPSLSGALARLHDADERQEAPTTDWNTYAAWAARQVPVYLLDRGIVKADIYKWRLGFDADIQRAIFPVRDETGNVVGALRRAVHAGQEPRYLDTPGAFVWKKRVFFGEHDIDRTVSTAIIVEGPMGAIFAARLFPNVLAMMGADTGVNAERLEKLQRWGVKTLVLMLDSDDKGRSAVYGREAPDGDWIPGLKEQLRRSFVVKVAKLPPKEDPDDVVRRDPTALREIVTGAAYLEATTLTSGPGHVKLPPVSSPQRGVLTKDIKDYLKNREQR
jgi:DNA primase